MVSLPTMDLKKLTFSDQLSSPRRKVISRLGLSIVLSLIIFSVVFCNFTFKIPFLNPVFSGLNSFSYSSFSWPFSSGFASFSNITANNGSNNSGIVKNFEKPVSVNDAFEINVLGRNKSSDFVRSDEKNDVLENAHIGNVSEKLKNGVEIEKNHVGVSFESVKNESGSDNESDVMGNSTNRPVGHYYNTPIGQKIKGLNDGNVSIYPSNGADGNLENKERKARRGNKSLYDCDIYNGRWVRDDTMPFYSASSCPSIDRDFDCHLNGRPDNEYVKWRWQPYDCEIPRFNVTDFLNRLRGKKLVFVGDSLNRNMWESLVCVLRQGVKDKKRVYEISGRHEFKKKGFYAFLFEDYNCTVDFVSSPFLVKESTFNGKNGSFETLRLDLMDKTTYMYHDADVLIFNTGHWWTHEKTSRGEDYYQEGNYIHPRLKVLEAYKRAIVTWARWVDKTIDRSKTHVIFRGYSVTHFRGGPWNSGGQCNKETEPIFNETYLAKYPSKMKILEYVLKGMKTPVTYLNISRLTDYRKDGHPSIYRPDYGTQQQQQQEVHTQDCSHWCLPGVPDTWNELLYVSLLKSRLGS